MNKFRCCRFHNLFVFLLVLSAFSLANHYLADATALIAGTEPCQVQQVPGSCTADPHTIQGANLHGGFLLNEMQGFSALPVLWIKVEFTEPKTMTWKHPVLVRPPIFS